MNNLGNNLHPSVMNPEFLFQGLESAVVAAVSEAPMEHVKWHGCVWRLFFQREGKSRLGIDEAPNQPGGCGPVHTGSRSRDPDPAFVVLRLNLRGLLHPRRYARLIRSREQLPYALLQRAME